MREKLIEILRKPIFPHELVDPIEAVADYLLDSGVTVQEWVSVKDRLPENDQWALCFMEDKSFGTFRVFQWNYIDWQWNDGNEWFDEKDVTHWMPLPEPPKGE